MEPASNPCRKVQFLRGDRLAQTTQRRLGDLVGCSFDGHLEEIRRFFEDGELAIEQTNRHVMTFASRHAAEDEFVSSVQMHEDQRARIIPGAEHWPRFERNLSAQFEARFVMVEVLPGPSILFDGMAGSRMPVVVSHGEGRAVFHGAKDGKAQRKAAEVCLRYVDNRGRKTETYPMNPNGSPKGITGLTTADGRFTILMPHPERVFRAVQNSWYPPEWRSDGPWLRMFRNARRWVG